MRLRVIEDRKWQVLAACRKRGDCPLVDFLESLPSNLRKDGDRLLHLLQRVGAHGPPKDTQKSHQLSRHVWEFRAGRLRAFWFYDRGKIILISHALVKKSRKIDRSDIRKSEDFRRRYLAAKKSNDVKIEST